MRCLFPVLVLLLLLAGLALPVTAAGTNRMGYLSLEGVSIELHGTDARIVVDYALDPGTSLVILLFGSGDLQRKLEQALNFPSPQVEEMSLTRAVFTEEHAAESYGDRAYWFPAHRFGATFPLVKVEAPGYFLSFAKADATPKGFGYFGDRP
jgi:hypothetical protein